MPDHLPGITGLLEYRLDTALPIRELTQILLRGESTLSPGERELIVAVVSARNQTNFCEAAHTKAADLLLGETETARLVKQDIETGPVSEKMKALLTIATLTQKSGKAVTPDAIDRARTAGATDREIHDTVLITAAFCLFNRYVDGLDTWAPDAPDLYRCRVTKVAESGYTSDDHYMPGQQKP